MAKRNKKMQNRVWLNDDPELTACLSWRSYLPDDEDVYRQADFDIRDCRRTISLEFSYDNKRGHKDAIKKVNKLIDELRNFRDTLRPPGAE